MEVVLNHKKRKIKINAKVCNSFEKAKGLMFCRREKARALLFNFKKPTKESIHSCFVFFPFVAIWLDDKNEIIEIMKIKPFNPLIKPKNSFNRLVEVPLNKRYSRLIKLLVDD